MRYDVVVIGGSFAGLAAALYLARGRRTVCVVDGGSPRNRFAAHSHGFFGQDGADPLEMLAAGRAQVAAYPTTTLRAGSAVRAGGALDGFTVELKDGDALAADRLVLAFGISDELPPIPGLVERWGASVLHCPYCHGYEFAGQRLGVLAVSPLSVQQAMLIAQWGPTTLFLDGASPPDDGLLAELARRQVAVEAAPVAALVGKGTALAAVELADGRSTELAALYLAPRTRLNSTLGSQLGAELDEGTPPGPVIRTDAQRATTVPGVWAAGDITRSAHTVTWACGDGVMAGVAAHRSLVFPAPPTALVAEPAEQRR